MRERSKEVIFRERVKLSDIGYCFVILTGDVKCSIA